MLLYDSFTIALRYSVKLPFSQFARGYMQLKILLQFRNFKINFRRILLQFGIFKIHFMKMQLSFIILRKILENSAHFSQF